MTRNISLAEFVRSGAFGPLAINTSEEGIRNLLGEPDDVGRGFGKLVIHRYGEGRLEVSTLKGQVVLIAFYPSRGIELRGDVRVVDDIPSAARGSADAFVRWLEQEELLFRADTEDGMLHRLCVQGGATATFADGHLDSVQVS